MATTNVAATSSAIRSAISAASANDVLKIAAGTVAPFFWPSGSATKALTLAPQAISNPPTMQGINAAGVDEPDGWWAPANGQSKGTCSNVTVDGLKFEGPKFTQVQQDNGNMVAVRDIPNDGFGGFNWRVDCSYPGVHQLEENAGMTAFKTGTSHHLTFLNNTFIGYAASLHVNGDNITAKWNDFLRNCEDMIKLWSGDNGFYQYNNCRDFRGVSYYDAVHAWDWGPDTANPNDPEGVPPHADYFQIPDSSSLTGLSILSNYLEDNKCRVHGALYNGSGSNFKFNNNELRVTHTSALVIGGPVTNIQAKGNKIYRLRTIPQGPENPDGQKNDVKMEIKTANNVPIDYSNNACRKYWAKTIPSSWTFQNNKTVNDDTIFPDNWVHIRKEKVTSGPYAGVYGGGGSVVVTPGDALQDVDFNMLGAIPDPAFPSPDTRMTGCFEIPVDSMAFAMPSIWWGIGADAPLPTTLIGTTTSGAKLYRLGTAAPKSSTYHLAAAGSFLGGILCYYKDADGVMSNPSAVTSRFNVPSVGDRNVVFVKPR